MKELVVSVGFDLVGLTPYLPQDCDPESMELVVLDIHINLKDRDSYAIAVGWRVSDNRHVRAYKFKPAAWHHDGWTPNDGTSIGQADARRLLEEAVHS